MKSLHYLTKDLTLVVGDCHIAPNQNIDRASYLGWYIEKTMPDRVIFIGDFLSFDCLSDWDRNKRTLMEGRRYYKDVEAGYKFIYKMKQQIKKASPNFIFIEGNHEDRLRRYLEYDPTFKGTINYIEDLGITNWKIIPYKKYFNYKGVSFTHIPINEGGKPIGGKYVCCKALDIHQHSVVFGHTHKLELASIHRHESKHLNQALNIGCYFEHIDEYAKGSVTNYWRGIVLIDHYHFGRFNWLPISLGKLRDLYKGRSDDI